MKQAEIINIGRDIILRAWLLKKWSQKQKEEFLELLQDYEEKLKNISDSSANVILWFIYDLKDDIQTWKDLNIDNIEDDEYLENHLIVKNELTHFNSLIDQESFKKVFEELNKKEIQIQEIRKAIQKIYAGFEFHFSKISQENIAKNLLIFTQFERKLPIPALNRLLRFMEKYPELWAERILIDRLERTYKNFLRTFYNECLKCLKEKNINFKFIRFSRQNNNLCMCLNCEDASSFGLRSGDPYFEYAEILKKMG